MSKPQYRVTKAYGPWSVGHVFTDMPGNVARTLAARGLVEEVKAKKTLRAPTDRMLRAGADTITKKAS